jgi:preprotein translocase subunit YajC
MNLRSLKFLLAQQPGINPTAEKIKLFLLLGGMVLFFWFMIIQPQRKREKDLKTMLSALRPGDRIVTNSGIVGVVLALKDKTVSIRSSDAKLEILKTAIGEVTERGGSEGGAS